MSVTIPLRTLVAFATGLAVAVIAVFVFQAWRVDAAPGDSDTTFVPITPCRLMDTRPAPLRVGTQGTFSADDTKTIAARGSNGNCTGIPTDAVGVSLNVTAVDATQLTFLTFWPGGTRPTASNLNPAPGQPPTPNAVTTNLSGSGSFNIYNKAGSVNVIVDINGYYTKASLQELEAAQPFAVTAFSETATSLTDTPAGYLTLTVTAPVAGQVTLNSTAIVTHTTQFGEVYCNIAISTSLPDLTTGGEGDQWWQASDGFTGGSLSGTRTFDIAAGATIDYVLACKESANGGSIRARNLTALFTPAA